MPSAVWRAGNLTLDKMTVVNAEEAVIRHGLRDKDANVAFVWSSFTYLAENDPAKAKALDCPNGVDVESPTFIVARTDLLNETDPTRLNANRRQIGTYVANFLGAWVKSKLDNATPKSVLDITVAQSAPDDLAKSKPDVAAKKLVATYAAEGIKVTDVQARTELDARRPPDLADQLVKFTPVAGGVAPLATSLDVIIDFMVASGSLKAADRPAASTLLDRSILDLLPRILSWDRSPGGRNSPGHRQEGRPKTELFDASIGYDPCDVCGFFGCRDGSPGAGPGDVVTSFYSTAYGLGSNSGKNGLDETIAAKFFDHSLLSLYRSALKRGIDADFFVQGQDFSISKPIEIENTTARAAENQGFHADDESCVVS